MTLSSQSRMGLLQKSASLTDRDEGEIEIESSTGTSRPRPDGASASAPSPLPMVKADSNGSLDPDHRNRCGAGTGHARAPPEGALSWLPSHPYDGAPLEQSHQGALRAPAVKWRNLIRLQSRAVRRTFLKDWQPSCQDKMEAAAGWTSESVMT